MVRDVASLHDIDYIVQGYETFNFKQRQNSFNGSTVTKVWLNGWILPLFGVALGRVCAQLVKQACYDCFLHEINWYQTILPLCSNFSCQIVNKFGCITRKTYKGCPIDWFVTNIKSLPLHCNISFQIKRRTKNIYMFIIDNKWVKPGKRLGGQKSVFFGLQIDITLFILSFKMASTQRNHQRHQFKLFVRSPALV